jgi:uncharacterized membrane protein
MFATPRGRARLGLPLVLLAAAGLAVSVYLTYEKLSGTTGPCLVGVGCDIVNASQYSVILGIPVAAFGLAWSLAALLAALAWWRTGDTIWMLALYVGGLVGVVFEAYLVYLQLFVIHAVCSWCVVYGLTVVGGWLLAVIGVWQSRRESYE